MMYRLLVVTAALLLVISGLGSAAIYEKSGSGSTTSGGSGFMYYHLNDAPHGTPYVYYFKSSMQQVSHKYINTKGEVYDQDDGWVTVGSAWLTSTGTDSASASGSYSGAGLQSDGYGAEAHVSYQKIAGSNNWSWSCYQMIVTGTNYTISGTIGCINIIDMYIYNDSTWKHIISDTVTGDDVYNYDIVNGYDYRIIFDGAYYDFTCDGDEVFDYDACIWVYGYTCGIDTIKLYDNNSQLIETVYQASGYDIYEMQIEDGQEYTISFYDLGIVLCYNQTFTCTGDHVLVNYDRCEWVYPPSPWDDPDPIYVWAGYDYNIVLFKDEHGNFIENSQLAIYDKTNNQYLQRWTDASEGYTLLGARFASDHDVLLSLRTFDGIFTLDTTYPANGSAEVGEENITTTNWTIPIKYNLNVLPVDQYGVAMFDVFCGLSEYTPLNPGAFWGMDLSDQGYVAVTNCSGFSMCDIIAEKEGYADYKVEALNWTSKSALVKDYRHNIVMEEV